MVRQVSAERARWSQHLQAWILENGTKSDFIKGQRHPETFQVATFPEFTEPPDYFLKEAVPSKQMNFMELESYIGDLQTSGFDTLKLQVQFHRKFAAPLFALIMALIALPFGFSVGNRGAMTGIGLSIGIAMSYWGLSTLFDKVGGVGQLEPALAAWSPDVLFSLAGLYLLLRVRS
jgi:lipopolysaccharide export LptBFGC system permease protein LptF